LLSRWKKSGETEVRLFPCLPFPAHDQCQPLIADRCGDPNAAPQSSREIRVMGPTFSGSEDSLELALESWLEASFDEMSERPIFSVISGSATSISQCRFCTRLKTPGQPLFHSTALPSAPTVEAFKRYLRDLDDRAANSKIALLKE